MFLFYFIIYNRKGNPFAHMPLKMVPLSLTCIWLTTFQLCNLLHDCHHFSHSTKFFQILLTIAGYDELCVGFQPIRNGEILANCMFVLKLRYPCCPGKGKFKLPEGSVWSHPCICFHVP